MEEQKVKIELNVTQLNTVLSAVMKMPIEVGLDTFQTIQIQATQQLGQQPNYNRKPDGTLASKMVI